MCGGCFVVVQSLSRVWLFAMPLWTAAHQASLSFTISWSLLKLMSIKSVTPSTISSSVVPFSCCLQSFPASWCLRNCNQSQVQTAWKTGLPSKVGKDTVEQVCRGLALGSLDLRCLLDFPGERPSRQFCSWVLKRHVLQISSLCSKLQFVLSCLPFKNERGENEKCARKST